MRKLIASAALAAGLMLGSAALAATPQASTADSGTTGPVVQHEVVGRTMINAPIDRLTVSRPVSYAGMDLTNPADVKILDRRIHVSAEQDCAQLRDQTDLMDPTIQGGHCVRSAEHDARLSLNAAVSAAKGLQ